MNTRTTEQSQITNQQVINQESNNAQQSSQTNNNGNQNSTIEQMADNVSNALGIAASAAEAIGGSLPRSIAVVGELASATTEAMRHPSQSTAERIVCGTARSLVQGIASAPLYGVTAAAGAAVGAAAMPTPVTAPYGAATGATASVMSAAPAINQVTVPVGDLADRVCRIAFDFGRSITQANPTPNSSAANSTASLLTSMGFSQRVVDNVANHPTSNDIVRSSMASSLNLRNAEYDFRSTMSSNTNNMNLSSFSTTSRPDITYTSTMDRQVALANSNFMFSSFHEPKPEVTANHSSFFGSSGGGGNGGKHCDPRLGNCNSQRNCGNSSSGRCENKLR